MILKHYKTPIFNIPNGEKLDTNLLRLGARQECPFSPLLFNIVLGVLVNAVVQGKERKIYRLGKRKIKIAFFTDDIIVFVENLKEWTERLIHNYSNVAEYKVNI